MLERVLAGLAALHPQRQRLNQELAVRGMAGRCGLAGHAVNPPPGSGPAAGGCAFGRLRSSASQAKRPHPWGLGRGIHAADTPATGPIPPSTISGDLSDLIRFISISDRCVDQGRHLPTAQGICQRRGGVGVRGVSRMDAAAKPTWTYLRRPRTPTPPRQPAECPLLPLLRLLHWLLQVQGAALPNIPYLSWLSLLPRRL